MKSSGKLVLLIVACTALASCSSLQVGQPGKILRELGLTLTETESTFVPQDVEPQHYMTWGSSFDEDNWLFRIDVSRTGGVENAPFRAEVYDLAPEAQVSRLSFYFWRSSCDFGPGWTGLTNQSVTTHVSTSKGDEMFWGEYGCIAAPETEEYVMLLFLRAGKVGAVLNSAVVADYKPTMEMPRPEIMLTGSSPQGQGYWHVSRWERSVLSSED